MALKNPPIERILSHGLLAAGALLFAFPFLWMIATSVKVPREMAAENLSFLPTSPAPPSSTPYVDSHQYEAPGVPDGVKSDVWAATLPALESLIAERLAGSPAVTKLAAPEVTEGLLTYLGKRLSDDARRAGKDALVAEAGTLVTDAAISEVQDACSRRFCVGDVRVRAHDYTFTSLFTGTEWKATAATLDDTIDGAVKAQLVRSELKQPIKLELDGNAPEGIDRIYLSYRGDASWMKVQASFTVAGRDYVTDRDIYLYERDWVEQEFRLPSAKVDPMASRAYHALREVGPAAAGCGNFAVHLVATPLTHTQAWLAKLQLNYRQTFREVPYERYIATSFSLAILNIILTIFCCSLVAYGFARLRWPGREFCFLLLLGTLMVPPQVTMIPSFLVIKELGWYNTLLPLWLLAALGTPYAAPFGAPFFVFLLRQFFRNIPTDLEDAAKIDGCGFLRIYWHVMLPLVKPVLATIAIFTFMGTWNNFMGPLILLNDERLFPLALGLFKFSLHSGENVTLMMAGSLMMTLPIIMLFFFTQRYFIQGISLTGSKA